MLQSTISIKGVFIWFLELHRSISAPTDETRKSVLRTKIAVSDKRHLKSMSAKVKEGWGWSIVWVNIIRRWEKEKIVWIDKEKKETDTTHILDSWTHAHLIYSFVMVCNITYVVWIMIMPFYPPIYAHMLYLPHFVSTTTWWNKTVATFQYWFNMPSFTYPQPLPLGESLPPS